jgi:MFS family permease
LWGFNLAEAEPGQDRGLSLACLVAALACAGLALAVQWPRMPSHDVAYLAWVAQRMTQGAVFGRDIFEINPPMAAIIYLPAAALAQITGLPAAIKLCHVLLMAVSLTLASMAAPRTQRLWLVIALGLFIALAFPSHFAQREQVALLCLLPYLAGVLSGKRLALAGGVLAGLGLCTKPHFLLVWLLVLAVRRKPGWADIGIVIAGAGYAFALALLFRPYLFEMVPLITQVYASILPQDNAALKTGIPAVLLAFTGMAWLVSGRAQAALVWGIASLGFLVAAYSQGKFLDYHFIPAWGCLIGFAVTTATGSPGRPAAQVLSAAAFAGVVFVLGSWSVPWLTAKADRYADVPRLVGILDTGDSFAVLGVHPYPAFPTAIYTRARYVGMASSHGGLVPAEANTGDERGRLAAVRRFALRQALLEIEQQPDWILVDTDWRGHSGSTASDFDALAWLRAHREYERHFAAYRLVRQDGDLQIYRRQPGG